MIQHWSNAYQHSSIPIIMVLMYSDVSHPPYSYISKVRVGRLSAYASRTSNIHEGIGRYTTATTLVAVADGAIEKLLLTQANLLSCGFIQLTF